jgi:hypothetical protein
VPPLPAPDDPPVLATELPPLPALLLPPVPDPGLLPLEPLQAARVKIARNVRGHRVSRMRELYARADRPQPVMTGRASECDEH